MERPSTSHEAVNSTPSRFQFTPPHGPIDWQEVRSLDPESMIRHTDLDALERVLDSVAYGSLEAAHPTDATPEAVTRLFGASQLAIQYLLYLQDHLAAKAKAAKREAAAAHSETKELRKVIAELRVEVVTAQREARHSRRLLKATLSHAARSTQASEVSETEGAAREDQPYPQDKDRLKRLEDGIQELLAWKQLVAAPQQQRLQMKSQGESIAGGRDAKAARRNHYTMNHSHSIAVQNNNGRAPSPLPSPSTTPVLQSIPSCHQSPACQAPGPQIPDQESTQPCQEPSYRPLRPLQPVRTGTRVPQYQVSPAPNAQTRQFLREVPYEAVGHERPGVLSRFPHRLSNLRAMRRELQAELDAEVRAELESQGIDSDTCGGLTPAQYVGCTDALQRRRSQALATMGENDRSRENYMRNTITWHINSVAKAAAAAGAVQATQGGVEAHDHHGRGQSNSPNQSAMMCGSPKSPLLQRALADVADEETEGFYSPLRKGTSEPGTPGASNRF